MLKKIPLRDVRIGMFLHALDGSWLNHPFWRTQFVIEDEDTLAQLQAAQIDGVWIDISKGDDVAPVVPAPAPVAAPPPMPQAPAAPAPSVPATCSMADELNRARAVCEQSRKEVMALFQDVRLGRAISTEACQAVVSDIADSVYRQSAALISLARIKTADDYTYMHSVAVCALMVALGRELGLPREQCEAAGSAGLFHDIGKARVPLAILNKPGKLTDAEFNFVKTHAQMGHDMLHATGAAAPATLDVALHHHEKFDGSGYPHRLAGEQIGLLARMGAVCDVYDALTSNRPYKAGWDPAHALAQMASWQGHFDPAVFKAFVKSLGIYPVGSLLRLKSGRLAVVTEVHGDALTKPTVKIFFSTSANMPIPVEVVDLRGSSDAVAQREQPEAWGFKQLDALWQGGRT